MKKELAIILTILLIAQVTALEIQTDKDEFMQGETFLATITGNILENIKPEDVGFYRRHVQMPFTFDITKINKTYYIYAILPYTQEQYTLKIKDVYFKENNQVRTQDIEKNFTVTDQISDFNIRPGFITATDNFTITLYNNLNSNLEIIYNLENKSKSTTLPLQESKKLIIETSHIEKTTLTTFEISSPDLIYNIPAYIIKTSQDQQDSSENEDDDKTIIEEIKYEKLRFDLPGMRANLNKNQPISYLINLLNLGNADAKDVTITVSDELKNYITLSQTTIEKIETNQEIELNFTVAFNKTGDFTGYIKVESENSKDEFLLKFNISQNITPTSSVTTQKTCADFGLTQSNVCEKIAMFASDGPCCATISTSKKPKSTNWTAIAIVIGLLLVIGFFVLIKIRKPKPTAKDIMKKRSQKFSQKYETRGKLERT